MRIGASEMKDVIPEEMSQCDQLKTLVVGSDERLVATSLCTAPNCDTRLNEGRDTPSRSRGAPSRRGKVKKKPNFRRRRLKKDMEEYVWCRCADEHVKANLLKRFATLLPWKELITKRLIHFHFSFRFQMSSTLLEVSCPSRKEATCMRVASLLFGSPGPDLPSAHEEQNTAPGTWTRRCVASCSFQEELES